jgi:hypothetical protein
MPPGGARVVPIDRGLAMPSRSAKQIDAADPGAKYRGDPAKREPHRRMT